ncbi:unnamed protein product [Cylindrotheca closterium]|uniref:Uncharacterized protein n=1 Tax=Cylindrotheca closterium TaxID=2856 RepID=A0AAD2PYB4_9STRA|nr:unnamed protein product [Cylindrotheca closterium]
MTPPDYTNYDSLQSVKRNLFFDDDDDDDDESSSSSSSSSHNKNNNNDANDDNDEIPSSASLADVHTNLNRLIISIDLDSEDYVNQSNLLVALKQLLRSVHDDDDDHDADDEDDGSSTVSKYDLKAHLLENHDDYNTFLQLVLSVLPNFRRNLPLLSAGRLVRMLEQ